MAVPSKFGAQLALGRCCYYLVDHKRGVSVLFQQAIETVRPQVIPLGIATKLPDSDPACGIAGAGMIINPDGWFITAQHIFNEIGKLHQQIVAAQETDTPPETVSRYTVFFGPPRVSLERLIPCPEIDLCIGKLKNYTAPSGFIFPTFRSRPLGLGEILCRIGFPLLDPVPVKWDNSTGFEVATSSLDVPHFVNDAMVSRLVMTPTGPRWIETSTPGIPGQSGGPLVDTGGLICGLDSHVEKYSPRPNRAHTIGRAVHVHAIREELLKHNIQHQTL
ncbi:MAG: trypsin-like peptidase domain-containing protein [Chloroflexi bacterium]|nr:trypsin-like peptidase domain-containing protein [Chloroflexota bacterium]